MKTTSAYLATIASIRAAYQAKQTALDAVAATARAAHVAAMAAAPLVGVALDSPIYPLAVLLSQGITIGRADGYPSITVHSDARAAVTAAYRAGLIPSGEEVMVGALVLNGCDSSSRYGISVRELEECYADYRAWKAASDFREANKDLAAL